MNQILPKLTRVVYLHHQNVSEVDIETELHRHCEYRILIGTKTQPACLAPSGSRRTDSGIAYYRLYRQELTYLYFRGFSYSQLIRFQEDLQLQAGTASDTLSLILSKID